MKLVLVSNFLNIHMLPLCMEFNKSKDIEKFTFIALEKQSIDRSKLGFTDINKKYSFVLCAYENDANYEEALSITGEADVAIIADANSNFIHKRMKNDDKLTFLCSERYYKKGIWRIFNPKTYSMIYHSALKYKKKNLYYLTIGAYMPYDLHMLGFPLKKCFQWAYFPQINSNEKKNRDNKTLKILWVGRMLNVKHPETAIEVASKLKSNKTDFELTVIGDGIEFEKVSDLVKEKKLENVVNLLGVCPPESVQQHMLASDIFLFTSDYWEGWGAVLNEAMGNACIPIASEKAGASSILIENGINGYIYRTADQVVEFILKIIKDKKLKISLSKKAQKTIFDIWTPQIAVSRFINVSNALLCDKEIPNYSNSTPMAFAELKKARNYLYTDK